jgi:hypothetical protein
MASSQKAAEAGTVLVPRSYNGSVGAARPVVTSPWAAQQIWTSSFDAR